MRRVVVAAAVLLASFALSVRAPARLRFVGYPVQGQVYQGLDATTKGCAIEYTNAAYSWINDTYRVWSGATIRRYNKGIVRFPVTTSKSISFNAQCTTKSNSDQVFSIVVDGALATSVTGSGDTFVHRYDVAGLPSSSGGSTIEIWEPFTSRIGSFNTQSDQPVEGCIVTGVFLPSGSVVSRPTSSTAIVTLGDSILGDTTDRTPELFYSEVGQFRLQAEAKGWLVVSLDYGSRTLVGDGPTASQVAQEIQDAAASTGATTVWVYFQIGRNDYAYYNLSGFGASATTVGTSLASVITALPSSYHVVVMTPLPNTSEGANPGGFTLGNYRTSEASAVNGLSRANTTVLDGSSCGIVPGTDTGDGVHLNHLGVAKAVTCAETGGLPLP